MTNIVFPLGITFKTWSDQIRQDLINLSFPIADSEEGWRDWAAQVVNENKLANVPVPTNLAYPKDEDWRIWASYFVDIVYNL